MSYYYKIEISHNGLNKFKIIKGATKWEAEQKASAQMAQWNEQWEKRQIQQKKQYERMKKIEADESALRYAEYLTEEANEIQNKMDSILIDSMNNYGFDFSDLKDNSNFNQPKPTMPSYESVPDEPQRSNSFYNTQPTFFTRLSKNKMASLKQEDDNRFAYDHQLWKQQADAIRASNLQKNKDYEQDCIKWEKAKEEFYALQNENNANIDEFEKNVKLGDKSSIESLFSLMISKFKYPFDFDTDVDVQYFSEDNQLIIEMFLPIQENIPTKKSVSFIKSRQEYKESFYPESYIKKKYDNVIYQIVLKTLNQCFNIGIESIKINSIVFNGRVQTIDKSTGNEIQPCILSVAVRKEDFDTLNLHTIDPKAWFKNAKGVSASSLVNLTPIAPIMEMNKEDKRFIDAYDVADTLTEGENIATMNWQDFENLIREIFEKEFNSTGGEVKITQASRDGGVDAVAFDPDPIRGGKIVIQAKRYTNVVGVSAVRDLYGTVMNEGAIKGILVTTSHYGSDAYEFAKDKPLTLMNGANLIYLLEKHGYNARIDIKEAKKKQD